MYLHLGILPFHVPMWEEHTTLLLVRLTLNFAKASCMVFLVLAVSHGCIEDEPLVDGYIVIQCQLFNLAGVALFKIQCVADSVNKKKIVSQS